MADRPELLVPLASPLIEILPRWVEPLDLLAAAAGRRHRVLLLSGLEGHPAARYSILAWDPVRVVRVWEGGAEVVEGGGAPTLMVEAPDPLHLLGDLMPVALAGAESLPFLGGGIGYLGYGLRRAIERLPGALPEPQRQPRAWFGIYDAALVFDHDEHRVRVVSTGLGGGSAAARERRAVDRLQQLSQAVAGHSEGTAVALPGARWPCRGTHRTGREEYLQRVGRALDYIAAGDIYQVNLSHRIDCPFSADPVGLFRGLANRTPAPFAAFLDTGPLQVLSASPERFLSLRDNVAVSSPIKGTRPRGLSPESDARLARELVGSAKERAENIMIVDLVRNDLGRVCETGSVRVDRLCALESFATVHHLVSTVSGRLRGDRDRIDLLRALFPGGSMTGAPKIRAMQIIDELEAEERGIYSGSIGYLSLDGSMDLNIVIRTIVCGDGTASLRVGGGIVADSDPEAEFRETLAKGEALMEVLGAVL